MIADDVDALGSPIPDRVAVLLVRDTRLPLRFLRPGLKALTAADSSTSRDAARRPSKIDQELSDESPDDHMFRRKAREVVNWDGITDGEISTLIENPVLGLTADEIEAATWRDSAGPAGKRPTRATWPRRRNRVTRQSTSRSFALTFDPSRSDPAHRIIPGFY